MLDDALREETEWILKKELDRIDRIKKPKSSGIAQSR